MLSPDLVTYPRYFPGPVFRQALDMDTQAIHSSDSTRTEQTGDVDAI